MLKRKLNSENINNKRNKLNSTFTNYHIQTYEVEQILNKKIINKEQIYYLIKLKYHNINSWISADYLTCDNLILEFENNYDYDNSNCDYIS